MVIWKSYRILHLISQDRAEVAHVAHNHKVGGSNPSPATNKMIGWSHQIIKPIEWPVQQGRKPDTKHLKKVFWNKFGNVKNVSYIT